MFCQVRSITLGQTLKLAFQKAFERTETIFDLVAPEAYYQRPIALRHPIVFYEGHLAAFIWNTLFKRTLGQLSLNATFDRLFERGIDPLDMKSASAVTIEEWPEREEIRRYVKTIHQALFDYLDTADFKNPSHPLLENGHLIYLILEHELMHQETLLYMIHQLPENFKIKPLTYLPSPDGPIPLYSIQNESPPTLALPHKGGGDFSFAKEGNPFERSMPTMVQIPAGMALLGTRTGEFDFSWDNEHPAMTVAVDAFEIDRYNVTNGDYLAFIQAGGYERPEFWTSESWQWKLKENKSHPFFWKHTSSETTKSDNVSSPEKVSEPKKVSEKDAKEWMLQDFFDERPLPLSWPVFVTHAEASAYARFVGKVLPTEAEWHRAAFGDEPINYPWGNAAPTQKRGNFDFHHWSAMPIGSFPEGISPFGVEDLTGNGWEWTSTVFSPFPGFWASEAYPLYSQDFFDGQHYVMKGGSCFTDARLLRRSLRNWYYWHYPYMYAGFRCVLHE